MVKGVGIDIVAVGRVHRLVRHHGEHFLERTYTADERRYLSGQDPTAQYAALAGHLAAKEAAYKVLSGAGLPVEWRDVEVTHRADGAPALRLHRNAERAFRTLGLTQLYLSISHTRQTAVAVVVAV